MTRRHGIRRPGLPRCKAGRVTEHLRVSLVCAHPVRPPPSPPPSLPPSVRPSLGSSSGGGGGEPLLDSLLLITQPVRPFLWPPSTAGLSGGVSRLLSADCCPLTVVRCPLTGVRCLLSAYLSAARFPTPYA